MEEGWSVGGIGWRGESNNIVDIVEFDVVQNPLQASVSFCFVTTGTSYEDGNNDFYTMG